MQNARIVFIIGSLIVVTIFFARCLDNTSQKTKDPRGEQYAGAATCMNCHKNMAASFPHTNHYKTSAAVNSSMLEKIADTSKKYFYYTDSSYVRFEEDKNGF